MSSTTSTRPIDSLGRVVIPKDVRNALSIKAGTEMKVHTSGSAILLIPIRDHCVLCDREDRLVYSKNGKKLCAVCLAEAEKGGESP